MWARSLAVAALLILAVVPLRAGDGKAAASQVFRGKLDAKDPPDRLLKKSPHRVHAVTLEAGKVYQIDLESKDFDAFLRLEDAQGQHLAHDDNSGGGTNARLVLSLKKGAVCRVIVTAFLKGQPSGAYTLTVRLADERVQREQTLRALTLAGVKQYQRGEHAAAERLFRQALTLCRQLSLKARHPHLASNLNNLGMVLRELGKLEEARGYLEQALAIHQKALPSDPLHLANSLNNLGLLLQDLGKREEARGYLEQALATHKKALPRDDPRVAGSLRNLGALLRDLGKLDEARDYLEQALAIHQKTRPLNPHELAHSLNNLGLLRCSLGKAEEARPLLEQALALWKKMLPPTHPDLAASLNNLGTVLQALGKLGEARGYLEQALAIRKKALPPDHPHVATSLNNLGQVLWGLGELEEARGCLEQTLVIFKKALPPDHPHLASTLASLSMLLWTTDRRDEAWPLLSGSVAASARYLRRVAFASAQRDHPELLRTQRRYLDYLLSVAAGAETLSASQRQELLLRLLEGKGISTATLGNRQALLSQADPVARALAEQCTPFQRRLADLLLQGPGKRSPQEYHDACLDLQRQVDALERDLGKRLQAFARLQKAHRATPADLADRLSAGTVLVETVRYDSWEWNADPTRERWGLPRYAAALLWADAAGPQVRLVDLGEAGRLEQAIAAWRRAVQKGQVDGQAEQALRQRLWQPLARMLPEKTSRLVIAPDGELALLPFEALRLADGKYLVESLKISYVSSGRDLMPLPQPGGRSDVALILADPAYDVQGKVEGGADKGLRAGVELPKRLRFRSLPGFAREANAVAQLLQGQGGWRVEARRGEVASEETLARGSRPRLLYCITHGFFLKDLERQPEQKGLRDLDVAGSVTFRPRLPRFDQDPRLRSGLALAGANQWQERAARGLSDGLLTALEVESLDLWGTELVVLSACETGLGAVQVGEGVLGLRRAFQLAGAQTVVASLWKVPDAETEQLMTSFLGRWLKGEGKAESLRAAQLDLIRALRQSPGATRREAPPLYWAGFICHGQAR